MHTINETGNKDVNTEQARCSGFQIVLSCSRLAAGPESNCTLHNMVRRPAAPAPYASSVKGSKCCKCCRHTAIQELRTHGMCTVCLVQMSVDCCLCQQTESVHQLATPVKSTCVHTPMHQLVSCLARQSMAVHAATRVWSPQRLQAQPVHLQLECIRIIPVHRQGPREAQGGTGPQLHSSQYNSAAHARLDQVAPFQQRM
jgi:hypothetical protein